MRTASPSFIIDVPKRNKSWYGKYIWLGSAVLLLVLSLGGLPVLFYGSIQGAFRGCEYSETVVSVPSELANTTLTMETRAYVVEGPPMREECGSALGTMPMLVNEATIDNITIGARYYEREGKSVRRYSGGDTFTLDSIVAREKHGLSTIDSGSGPIYHLVLRHESGAQYHVATVEFPAVKGHIQEGDLVFLYNVPGSAEPRLLSWAYFEDTLR